MVRITIPMVSARFCGYPVTRVSLYETREYLLEDLAYAQAVEKFAYVGGVGKVSYAQPRGNLTGDPWFSDGNRLVLWVSSVPVDIEELEFVPWRSPIE